MGIMNLLLAITISFGVGVGLFKTLSHDGHYRAQVDLNRVSKSNAIKAVDVAIICCKLIQMRFILMFG